MKYYRVRRRVIEEWNVEANSKAEAIKNISFIPDSVIRKKPRAIEMIDEIPPV